ncbi:MAG TPA: DNA polymerase III subunit delta [Dehalococcoidia bacterium]|nr:DNA polymerase III subunit delta [Dehalococcoidia bacterium]
MIYIFHGPDQFRAREELRALRKELDREGDLANNTQRLEGKGLSPADLRAACHAASFFATSRLVIVEGLQERFRGTRRRGRSRASATAGEGASEFDQFVDVLTNLPPSTTVVLLDEPAPSALIEALGSLAEVQEFKNLRGAELRSWASARAKTQSAALTPAALERLITLVDGFHLGELAQEIDKLATYANGRAIDVDDVDALVSASVQIQFWDLTDAVIEGRSEKALSVWKSMDARDHPPQLLAFMLVRQYRQLLLAQALLRQGLNADQVGSQLNLSGYPLRKTMDQATRYPADRLETAYRWLLASDVAVKTGVLDVEVALEMLIVELSELGKSRGPTRSLAMPRAASGANWRR